VSRTNKISYRKQIARQHSCHKIMPRAGASVVVDTVEIFLIPALIIVQNFVAVFFMLCEHV